MVSWYIRAAVPNHRATDRVDKQMAHNKWLKVKENIPITMGMQNNFQNPILKVFCLHVSSKEAWYKFFFLNITLQKLQKQKWRKGKF